MHVCRPMYRPMHVCYCPKTRDCMESPYTVSLRSSVGNQLYLLEVKPQPLTNTALQIESGEGIPFPLEAARYGGAVSHPKEICIFFSRFCNRTMLDYKTVQATALYEIPETSSFNSTCMHSISHTLVLRIPHASLESHIAKGTNCKTSVYTIQHVIALYACYSTESWISRLLVFMDFSCALLVIKMRLQLQNFSGQDLGTNAGVSAVGVLDCRKMPWGD